MRPFFYFVNFCPVLSYGAGISFRLRAGILSVLTAEEIYLPFCFLIIAKSAQFV